MPSHLSFSYHIGKRLMTLAFNYSSAICLAYQVFSYFCGMENTSKFAQDKFNTERRCLLKIAIAVVVLLFSVDTVYGKSLPKSILTKDNIYLYMFSDTALAKRIIAEMRRHRLAPQHTLDIAEGDLLSNNGRYKSALPFYERALNSKAVRADSKAYMSQLHRMITCYDGLHDDKQEIRYVKLLLDKAKACGDKAMHSVALFNMGKTIYYQKKKKEGYRMIKEAIALMESAEYEYKYDNLRYEYNTLFIMQQKDGLYKAALKTLESLEHVVTRGTGNESKMQGLAEKELKTLYANRAVVLCKLGRDAEADSYYRKWRQTAKTYTNDDYLIAPYLSAHKKYGEVIRIYSAREEFLRQQKDTINYHFRTIKRELGNAFAHKHEWAKAAFYYNELATITDSLKAREQQSAALELAETYRTHEQSMLLKEQSAEIRLHKVVIVLIVAFLLAAMAFIVRILRDKRIISHKNGKMVKTINELIGYKDKLLYAQEENLRIKQKAMEGIQPSSPTGCGMAEKPSTTKKAGTDVSVEKDLYERINFEIINRRLYLESDYLRKEIIAEFHIPANKFAALFKNYAKRSFSQYIQDLRLDYAIRLMGEKPSWSLEAIAKESRLSRSRFHELFMKKYGVTPSEFRKNEESLS